MNIEELILRIVREKKPPRLILPSLVYFEDSNAARDWTVTYHGIYSRRIMEVLDEMILSGKIIVCQNDRLVVNGDTCPDTDYDSVEPVRKAINKYMKTK